MKKSAKPRANARSSIDIGISKADRAAIAAGLSRLLADTYTLYLTTHNFHWNVRGPMFNSLHDMFMTQYTVGFRWWARVSVPASLRRPAISAVIHRRALQGAAHADVRPAAPPLARLCHRVLGALRVAEP